MSAPPSLPEQVKILILGAGPTGLGAATRLQQHGEHDWLLLEQAHEAGGLACTHTTPQGFLFDMGGHVIFSHWAYFDELLDAALGGPDAWNEHQRVSYVWIRGRWVAYPFQNNIAALDKDDQVSCLLGLVDARVANATAGAPPTDFDEWILRVMGRGIADLFMRPYNFKVWAVPTTKMACGWLGERVATVDVARAIDNVVHGREDAGWGPNAVFRFPKLGGTGAIWRAVAALLPEDKQLYGMQVTSIDQDARQVMLANGRSVRYDSLITTAPLDLTLMALGRSDWAARLHYSSSHIIGVGVRGACPLGSKCWLYFPEDNCPFYRATVFSNYAEANCPPADACLPTLCLADGSTPPDTALAAARVVGDGGGWGGGGAGVSAEHHQASPPAGPYWSLMFEVSESSSCKPVDQAPIVLGGAAGSWPAVVRDTLQGAIATQLLRPHDQVVSLYHRRLEHGYPTPTLERDAVLDEALPWLKERGILSRGRFGSYKYEVANQDHSLMLGVEAVDNILFGSAELTLHHPERVNSGKDATLRYERAAVATATHAVARARDL